MPRPQLVSASTDSSYCSLDNGSITLHATSGVGTLTYSLDNSTFQSDSVFTGLDAGTYTGYVKDSLGCVDSISTQLDSIQKVSITQVVSKVPTCDSSNGEIMVSAAFGTRPFTYAIDGGAAQTDSSFTGLSNGVYTITITDNKGCAIDTSVRLIQADGPSIDSAFTVSEICDRQDGELTVFASGNGDMNYSLNAGTPQDSGRFTGLASGSYTITVTDTNGCSLDTIITIDELVACKVMLPLSSEQ